VPASAGHFQTRHGPMADERDGSCRPAWPCWDPRSRSGRSGRRGGSTWLGHSNLLRAVDAQPTSNYRQAASRSGRGVVSGQCRPLAGRAPGQRQAYPSGSAVGLRCQLVWPRCELLGLRPVNEVADRNAHKIKSPERCIGQFRTLFSMIEECGHYLELDGAKLILDLAAAIRQAMSRQVGLTTNVQTGPNNSWASATEQVA